MYVLYEMFFALLIEEKVKKLNFLMKMVNYSMKHMYILYDFILWLYCCM